MSAHGVRHPVAHTAPACTVSLGSPGQRPVGTAAPRGMHTTRFAPSRGTTWERRHSASSTTSRASRARRRRSCSRTGSISSGWPTRPVSAGYYLAEHHGSDLCMAPNQEMFIAAASQITQKIRLGPMVKLLPLHHPVRLIEDMCVVDNLTERAARLRRRPRRGADRALLVRQQLARVDGSGSRTRSGSSATPSRPARSRPRVRKYYDFRTMPMATMPVQEHIPFWYPGQPGHGRPVGLNLMWPGPIDREAYDVYVETWNEHKGDTHAIRRAGRQAARRLHDAAGDRRRRGRGARDRRRGMNGLIRRAHNVHRYATGAAGEEGDAALAPLRGILAHIEDAIQAGAGTPEQIATASPGSSRPASPTTSCCRSRPAT